MDKYLIDIPVAIVFFNRPDTLSEVFAAVKAAKPSQLFLIQDGARKENKNDEKKVLECREVVQNIDWDCKVVRLYSDTNLGCGMRVYSGLSEAFKSVDRLIILEDDIVVSQSFFLFCKEMLEKYKDDERIVDITGMNHCGVNQECPYSYFFSEIGSCWGWATWRRVWRQMEYDGSFLEDTYAVDCLRNGKRKTKYLINQVIEDSKEKRNKLNNGEKLSGWAHQYMMVGLMNSGLTIVPKYNLISNIGLSGDGTHTADSLKLIPRGLQTVFFANRHELEFPLSHPKYIIADNNYKKKVNRILGESWIQGKTRKLETIIRRIVFGGFRNNISYLKRKMKRK